MTTRCKLFDY